MTVTLLPRPTVGPPAPWRFPAVAEHQLSNGMRVLAAHLPGKLVATVAALVDLPVDADPPGQEGLAALAATCLEVGTSSHDEGEFAEALERQGASFNAHASYEGTGAVLQVLVSRLAAALPLLAEAVTAPAFPSAEVDRVMRQRLAEIDRERSGPPSRAAIEYAAVLHTPGSRQALPLGGTAETVRSLTAELVAAHYASRVAASTTTLLIAGDLSGLDVPGLMEQAFGGWTTTAERWTPVSPGYRTQRALVVDRPGAVQTQLLLGHAGPGRLDPAFPYASLAVYALGGTLTSRIDAVLREEKGYTYGIRASINHQRQSAHFSIGGSVDTGNTGPALQDLMQVLTTARSGGLREDELAAGKDYLVGVSPMRWETPNAVVAQLSTLVGNDLPLGWTDDYLERMRTAELPQVNAALNAHVRPEDLVFVAVGEAEAITGPLSDFGLTAEVVTA